MKDPLRALAFACLVLIPPKPGAATEGPEPVSWTELAGAPAATGKDVRIEGYLLPVDRDNDLVYEFLLVPWPGACIHTTAPPPDQLVRVTPAQPYRLNEIYEAVAVTGRLVVAEERQQVMMIDGVKQLDSAYGIARASVVHASVVTPSATGSANPWRKIVR